MAKKIAAVPEVTAADLFKELTDVIGENADAASIRGWLDTGLPELNFALGGSYQRGAPMGRVIECFGAASSGKCQPASTMVLGQDGLVSIGEMFELNGAKATCARRVEEHSYGLINELGNIEATSHLTWNGRKPVKVIKSKSGFATEATINHPLRVMDATGHIVWKMAGQVEIGDQLPMLRNTRQFGKGELTSDEARFIGYLIADGTMGRAEKFGLTNSDADVVALYRSFVHDTLGLKTSKNSKEGSTSVTYWTFGGANRQAMVEKYGLEICKAAGKTVPLVVRMSGEEAQKSFIRAFMELECSLSPDAQAIETSSASRKLLADIQLMLLNFGIVTYLRDKVVDGTTYYRMTINRNEAAKYIELIGFETQARLKLANNFTRSARSAVCDTVPNIGTIIESIYRSCDTDREGSDLCGVFFVEREPSYDNLAKIIAYLEPRVGVLARHQLEYLKELERRHFYFEEVVDIGIDEAPTFDVVMPGTHSFWANGFISHNTFLATMLMKSAQDRGGIAFFADHERSFSPEFAKILGMNVDSTYFKHLRPETFEDSIEAFKRVAPMLREKGLPMTVPLVWVFDSVAAMIPRALLYEKKGNVIVRRENADANMRDKLQLATCTSVHYPILKQFAEDYNVTVLLLNQIRMDPGVMFGNPEKTPGGKSGEFYADIRVNLGKKDINNGKTGADKEIVGFEITANVIKNKVARPFRKAMWQMRFHDELGVYVDRITTLVNFLVRKGIMEKDATGRTEWDGKRILVSVLIKELMADDKGVEKLMAMIDDTKLEDAKSDIIEEA